MILSLLFFICITIILFSFGHLFLLLSESFFSKKELTSYNFTDTIFLGLFALTFFLFIVHFFLALNFVLFLIILSSCTVYLIFSLVKKKIEIKVNWKQVLVYVPLVIFLLYYANIITDEWDATYYHLQYTESITKYPIIKGLGNLEDRYGFNSSFFIIQALFSFKPIIGFHFNILNSYFYLLVILYLVSITIKRLDCFAILALFVFSRWLLIDTSSSADVFVSIIGFYFIVRLLIVEDSFKNLTLLIVTIPCVLLVNKLSSIPFIIFTFYTLFRLVKDKEFKQFTFAFVICSIFGGLWLLRNIYLSGYLVYPLYAIDLFDVEWKVPKMVARIQKDYIYMAATQGANFNIFIPPSLEGLITKTLPAGFSYYIIHLSNLMPLLLTVFLINWKKQKKYFYIVLILSIGIYYSLLQAPTLRFYYVYKMGVTFIILYLVTNKILSYLKPKHILIFNYAIISIVASIFIYKNLHSEVKDIIEEKKFSLSDYIIRPQIKFKRKNDPQDIKIMKINNFQVYMFQPADYDPGFTQSYELFPSSHYTGLPLANEDEHWGLNPAWGSKIQSIKTIEQRGNSIADGFRTQQKWLDEFDKNEELYFKQYKDLANIRFNSNKDQ